MLAHILTSPPPVGLLVLTLGLHVGSALLADSALRLLRAQGVVTGWRVRAALCVTRPLMLAAGGMMVWIATWPMAGELDRWIGQLNTLQYQAALCSNLVIAMVVRRKLFSGRSLGRAVPAVDLDDEATHAGPEPELWWRRTAQRRFGLSGALFIAAMLLGYVATHP
ncbi:MAG: hypothetical protein AB7S36_06375 [Planctomycetota bacterium]